MIETHINIKTKTGEILKDGVVVETGSIMDLPRMKNKWIAREVLERAAAGTLEPFVETPRQQFKRERREMMGR